MNPVQDHTKPCSPIYGTGGVNAVSNVSSNEICRMSWFLIEICEDLQRGGGGAFQRQNNEKRMYCIIHAVDLIDGDGSNNMYINRMVRFNQNHAIVQGKVVLASDDRLFVERQMKKLIQEQEDAALAPDVNQRFLVQYNKGANNIIHAVVHQKEICWPLGGDLASQREVLIRDGKIQRLATVLYVHESEERMLYQLQLLKTRCFEAAFDENDHETLMESSPWLLVQYSCNPTNVVYAVVNFSETVWQAENLYKDVVAYLSDGISIYQSIIIRKSNNRNELDSQLRNIKESSLILQYPLETSPELKFICVTPKSTPATPDNQILCANTLQTERTQDTQREQEDDGHLKLLHDLERMELQMQREAFLIADAFEAVDCTRRTMEKHTFRLLANSKFITIDPDYGVKKESLTVVETINQMRLSGGSEVTSGYAISRPKKKHSFVPACIRSKKKTHKSEINRAFFYTDEIDDTCGTSNKQRENEQGPKKLLVHEIGSADSSCYKYEPKTVNEICKPRPLKHHSEAPSSTTGVARIGKLENQVEEMRQELSQMRKELIPQHDVQRYKELESRLKELNLILCDLKSNCVKGTGSSDIHNEKLQNMQYINPPCVRSETGTQTLRERHVEEKVLPTPRDKYTNENEEHEQKICVCDDCECKESGECLLKHEIEPHYIMLDEPKQPPPRKVENNPVIYVPLRRTSSERSVLRQPSPRRQEPLKHRSKEKTSKQPPPEPKRLVDSYTEMTDNSTKSSPERRNMTDSYTVMDKDSSYNAMECFGVCGDPKCGAANPQVEHGHEPKSKDNRRPSAESQIKEREKITENPSKTAQDDASKENIDDDDCDDEDEDEDDNASERNISVRKYSNEPSLSDNSLHRQGSYCLYCDKKEVPIISERLLDEILKLIRGHSSHNIALTILLQTDELYHINVSEMSSGLNIGCLYATEEGIKSGSREHIFEEFLTFFIVDSRNTVDQKNKILHHTFEFIREGDKSRKD